MTAAMSVVPAPDAALEVRESLGRPVTKLVTDLEEFRRHARALSAEREGPTADAFELAIDRFAALMAELIDNTASIADLWLSSWRIARRTTSPRRPRCSRSDRAQVS
ncbi:hypothetical protein [Rhodococcus sp. PvR099]|uniref:hypothetical protein n=1 Tax=Rhodococcus sp. PvR099 TaxID=2806602 RepID=UPI001AE80F72|nr:hypothetical protein [Rhodococcus sp. PvR099]MBP1159799.1 hypothetical protein [Rhodococcus sp. PvR099]